MNVLMKSILGLEKMTEAINAETEKQLDGFVNLKGSFLNYIIEYGIRIIIGIIIFFIGRKLIKYLLKIVDKFNHRSSMDDSIKAFVYSFCSLGLKVLLIVVVINTIGIATTSITAILGAASLAVGLAFQGSLSNFAGGVLILLLKPFKSGDFIKEESSSYEGIVQDIDIFYTKLKTRDNKVVYLPNGNLSNNTIVNYTALPTRRVDLTFSIGYDDSIDQAKAIIHRVINQNKLILKEPNPYIAVTEHGANSIDIAVLVWCKTEHYFDVRGYMLETMKLEFDKENINIPYPQMDVHIINS